MTDKHMTYPDRDELVRLTTVLSALVAEVKHLTAKVEELKDEHVIDLERNLAILQVRNVELDSRLQKIESNITWLGRTVGGETLALIGGIILWWIKTHG